MAQGKTFTFKMNCPHEKVIKRRWEYICTNCFVVVETVIGGGHPTFLDLFGQNSRIHLRKEKRGSAIEKVLHGSEKTFERRVEKGWGKEKDTKIISDDFLIFARKFVEAHGEGGKFPKKSLVVELLAKRRGLACKPERVSSSIECKNEIVRLTKKCEFKDSDGQLEEKKRSPFSKVMVDSKKTFDERVKRKWGREEDRKILTNDLRIFAKKFFKVHGENAKFPRKSLVVELLAKRRGFACKPERISVISAMKETVMKTMKKCKFQSL